MSVASPALPARTERFWAALLAATLMNLPLGSVYAFSVLLRPIEQELAIPRSALSLVFGLATVGFTVGSVGAAFLYRLAPVSMLVRSRQGLVNGYIVSLYPMGAMIATPAFHACNETFGWRTTLGGLAAVLVACGVAAALLARHGGGGAAGPAGGGPKG